MKELLAILAKSLVDHPEEVQIHQVEGERTLILELRVHPDDVGKVIGREGRIANAIRTVVNAAAMKEKKRVNVEIIS